MTKSDRYPAASAWARASEKLRGRLKSRHILKLVEQLELSAMAAGAELTREYYEKLGAGAQPRG